MNYHTPLCIDPMCSGECYHQSVSSSVRPDEPSYHGYRPRRLRHPDFFQSVPSHPPETPSVGAGGVARAAPATSHAPNGCPDAHCRIHQNEVPRRSSRPPPQPSAAAAAAVANPPTDHLVVVDYPPDAGRPPHAHQQTQTPSAVPTPPNLPSRDQRLLNAVWRMQYHPGSSPVPPIRTGHHHSSRMHPRHQRIWHAHQHHQELLRRHMHVNPSTVPPPLPAHMSHPFPFGGPPIAPGGHDMAVPPHMVGAPSHVLHPQPPGPTPSGMVPFLLQPVRYGEEYFRIIEQRRTMDNNRGASRGCIERNTFPHKFKKIVRCSDLKGEDQDEEVDKCTICLCGKYLGIF